MSQAGQINSAAGPVPPAVATTYVTDVNSPAIPALNVLNVLAADTTANNDNGIRTDGSSGSNTLTVQLTNRQTGSVTTADATPTTILTFSLGATPGVYILEGTLVAYDVTDGAGAGYTFSSAVRTTGAAGVEIGTEFKDSFEEAAMSASDFNVNASGNTLVISVIGIAGKTIDWNCYIIYRFVS